MRDLETIVAALTAAETGHLVFGTLHTRDSAQTIDRIVDVFPPNQQQQIRLQLSNALKGIVSQQLIPSKNNSGMELAYEILIGTPAIGNLIRESKTHQIYSMIETGARFGMKSMESSLKELYEKRFISYEDMIKRMRNAEPMFIEAVAHEVLFCHYNLMVGLIPLSETVHEMVHNLYLFIPLDKLFGYYKLFIEAYYEYIPEEILNKLAELFIITEQFI
jgi:hypothetical protein